MATSPFVLEGIPFGESGDTVLFEPIVGGTNGRRWMPQWAIPASIAAQTNVHAIFRCLSAPTGTLKAVLTRVANAATGNARVNLAWAAAAAGANFDTTSLSSEGVQSLAWATGNEYDLLQTVITLDATTAPTAGQYVIVQIGYETASWTLAAKSFWAISLIDD